LTNLKTVIIALLIALVFIGITVVFTNYAQERNNQIDDLSSGKQSKHNVVINLQVDAENTGEHLFKVLGELERRGYTTTVYVTGTFAQNNGLTIKEIKK
jgi:hypothetical protein